MHEGRQLNYRLFHPTITRSSPIFAQHRQHRFTSNTTIRQLLDPYRFRVPNCSASLHNYSIVISTRAIHDSDCNRELAGNQQGERRMILKGDFLCCLLSRNRSSERGAVFSNREQMSFDLRRIVLYRISSEIRSP